MSELTIDDTGRSPIELVGLGVGALVIGFFVLSALMLYVAGFSVMIGDPLAGPGDYLWMFFMGTLMLAVPVGLYGLGRVVGALE